MTIKEWIIQDLKYWKCLFLHNRHKNRDYQRFRGNPNTFVRGYNCKKCGLWWSNS